ncbi:hypothetical protein AAHE18_18G116600 [Arachis hypogaea]
MPSFLFKADMDLSYYMLPELFRCRARLLTSTTLSLSHSQSQSKSQMSHSLRRCFSSFSYPHLAVANSAPRNSFTVDAFLFGGAIREKLLISLLISQGPCIFCPKKVQFPDKFSVPIFYLNAFG